MRHRRFASILVLYASAVGSAAAADTTVELEYRGHYYSDGAKADPNIRQGFYAAIDVGQQIGRLSLKARASARSNQEADYGIYDDRLYLEEMKVVYSTEKMDIAAGRQAIRNGRATLVNPTDYFDQRDYRDALLATDRYLGTDGVKLTYRVAGFDVDAVYAPIRKASLMPHVQSRWFFALPDAIDIGVGDPVPVSYRWSKYDGTTSDPGKPQVMLKLNRDADSFSYAFSYFRGQDNLPDFEEGVPFVGRSGLVVPIVQSYPTKRSFGVDAEVLAGKFVLRAEAARVDLDYAGGRRDRYDHAVVGFDIAVDNGLFGKDTYLAVEYSKQVSRDGAKYRKENLRHIFSDALVARLELDVTSEDSVSGNVVYDTANGQSVAMIEWRHEFNDRLSMKTSIDILSGSRDTFFGQYGRNDRVGFGLEYVF